MSTPSNGTLLVSLRTMTGALIAAPLFILLAMVFVLGPTAAGGIPWLFIGIVVVIALADIAGLAVIGYRVPALPAGLSESEATQRSRAAYMMAMFRRFAFANTAMIISIALAFIATTGGIFVVLVGVAISVVLTAYHVWPSERVVSRTEQALEAGGVQSGLRESLGMAPRPPGFLS